MDPTEELAELRLKLAKAERELREALANLAVAESAARVAQHARDEQSAEIGRYKRAVSAATFVLAPLKLLLAQLQANPTDKIAWEEAHGLPGKVEKALRGEREDFPDAADTDPEITSPFPRPHQPFSPAPSARLPPPPKLPTLEPERTPTHPGLPALAPPFAPPKK